VFSPTAAATAVLPLFHASALVEVSGDFLILVYLLAFARFALMLGAMDGGSAFGGMGASREALVSTLAEAPLLLALTAAAIAAHASSIGGIVVSTLQRDAFESSAVQALAMAALALVAIAETGRIPVDNPTTHLELTMIHEAMVLEYSGPKLALIEWASAMKLTLVMALIVALFAPWGMAQTVTPLALLIAVGAILMKLLFLAAAVAVLESVVAKLRMYLVPDFLGVATALAVLALVFTAMSR
jgi:formate hydrogenlyase subunit 4